MNNLGVSGLGSRSSEINNKKGYKKLEVWQKAYHLAYLTYKSTEKFPKSEEYGLKQHIRKSVVSIPSNIAEGYMRQYRKEYIQFLFVALGSAGELETQLLLAKDLKFIAEKDYLEIDKLLNSTGAMLNKLIQVLQGKK